MLCNSMPQKVQHVFWTLKPQKKESKKEKQNLKKGTH
jgi:hypothetical protein